MTRFWNQPGQLFTRPARPAARRTRLALEGLETRDLLSVSPLGPPIGVAPIGDINNVRTVARSANGNFAVVWSSTDPNSGGVYCALYNATGKKLMSTQVDNDPSDSQATIAMDRNGEFAVAWVAGTGANTEVLTQRFDAKGNYVGHFNLVAGTYYNYDPSIALNDGGQLAVAYDQNTGDGNVYVNLWCQAGADQQGSYFAAGSSTGATAASIALNDDNQGVVAFTQDDATGTSIMGIFRFSPLNGVGGGLGLLHHGGGEYTDRDPSVAISNTGNVVLAYTNVTYGEPGFRGPIVDQQVEAYSFKWDDTAAGGFTQLSDQHVLNVQWNRLLQNFPVKSMQYRPSVAVDGAGDFVVTARQEYYKFSLFDDDFELVSTSVVGQVFGPDGSAQGPAFGVSSVQDNPTLHTQDNPSVAMDGAGNFVIAYKDSTPAGDQLLVMRFSNPNPNQGIVGEQDQTISFGALGDATYGDGPITLDATASSGLPVSYQVMSGPATIQDDVLTITGAGVVTVEASQAGDGVNWAAAAPVDQSFTINQAVTTVVLHANGSHSGNVTATAGQLITLTATVSPPSQGAGLPTGTVTFMDGAIVLGTAALDNNGVATFKIASLASGRHTITAVYGGDDNFTGSTSAVLTETVQRAASHVGLTSSAHSARLGQVVSLTARVGSSTPGAPAPSGVVTFKDGGVVVGRATVKNGVAVLHLAKLHRGRHTLTAVYGGDADFLGSSSAAWIVTIG